MTQPNLYVRVMGQVAVISAEAGLIVLSPTQRTILSHLVLQAPSIVPWEGLAKAIWGDNPPASARAAVQNQISRMRAVCGAELIDTSGDGYVLTATTDLTVLRDATVEAQASIVASNDDRRHLWEIADSAFIQLDDMISKMGDDPLGGLDASDELVAFAHSADVIMTLAESTRLEAAVLSGRWAWALIEGERLTTMMPTDERIGAHYARALALAGRRGDALAWLAGMRRALRLELGVGPGPELDAAEAEILRGEIAGASEPPESITLTRSSSVPFLGRDDELRNMLQAIAQNLTVQVVGEYGSGVSRILAEAQARLTALGVRTFFVRAEEHPQSAMSVLDQLLAEWDVEKDPSQNALSAFSLAVGALDGETPTVFIIDDAQFLGPSTWQALRIVAHAERGGLIIGGHRTMMDLGDTVEIRLGPLGADTSRHLVQHWGISVPRSIEHITVAAGGNPLAIELLARDLWNEVDGLPDAGSPSRFNAFLQRRIDELSAEHAQDLQLAAVAGDGYPSAALELIDWGHRPKPPASLVDVDAHGLLRFRYSALQPYLYGTIAPGVLLDMHYALALGAQEAGAPASTVARHFLAAAELNPDGAIAAARAAARESAQLGAHADAAGWLARAQHVAEQFTDGSRALGISLAIEHADALRLAGDPEHLTRLKEVALRAVKQGDEALIAQAGFALLQLGGSSPAGYPDEELANLAGQIIDTITDAELRAPVQAAASLSWSMTGNAEQARALFDVAEAQATSVAARLMVLPFAYLAVGRPSDLERRSTLAQELVTLATAVEEAVPLWEGLHLMFTVALQRGDGVHLRTVLREMESLIDSIGDIGRRWSTQYCAATVAHLDGDLERSETLVEQAYATFGRVSPERATAAYYSQLVPLKLARGQLSDLREPVLSLVEQQPVVTGWHAVAALVLAETGADASHAEQAKRHAGEALDTAQDDFTWLAAHVVGGRAAAKLGDENLIERYLQRLRPWAHLVCWQGTCSYGPVAEVLAELCHASGDAEAAYAFTAQATRLRASLADT